MAHKQAFQFWYEKESRRDERGASVTNPHLRCSSRKQLPESPPGCTCTQASGVVATLKLKWEQVPERSMHAASESRSSQSGNIMLDRPKKSSMPTRRSLLEGTHESGGSASMKSRDSKSTAKNFLNDQLLVLPKATKSSPAFKATCEKSRYGHVSQVILINHPPKFACPIIIPSFLI